MQQLSQFFGANDAHLIQCFVLYGFHKGLDPSSVLGLPNACATSCLTSALTEWPMSSGSISRRSRVRNWTLCMAMLSAASSIGVFMVLFDRPVCDRKSTPCHNKVASKV